MVTVPELIVENLFNSVIDRINSCRNQSDQNDRNQIEAFEKQKVN